MNDDVVSREDVFTAKELLARWNCSAYDLHCMSMEGIIKPLVVNSIIDNGDELYFVCKPSRGIVQIKSSQPHVKSYWQPELYVYLKKEVYEFYDEYKSVMNEVFIGHEQTFSCDAPPVETFQTIADLEHRLREVTRERDEAIWARNALTVRVAALEAGQEKPASQEEIPRNANMQLGNLKKRVRELTDGYAGAAKLAHVITAEGQKQGTNPWSESEILALAEELRVTIKGDCLKSFKSGMPADLVKKDVGARPTTPREESPDVVGS